jgi:capsular polysaccharide biosynthesis protein
MARQRKLLGALNSGPSIAAASLHVPQASAEALAEIKAREQAAVQQAFSLLNEGQLDAAAALLDPLAIQAQDPQVLTTLARIRSIQGDFDAAFALLSMAERIDPSDLKVIQITADLLKLTRRPVEELHYRRRAAYIKAEGQTEAFVRLIVAIVKAAPVGQQPPLAEIRLALDRLKTSPPLTPELQLELAKALFSVDKLAAEARQLYEQIDPPAAGDVDLLARWKPLLHWCETSGTPVHRITDFGVPGKRPTLAEARDAVVHPAFQWMPILDGGTTVLSQFAASRIRTRSEDAGSPLLMAGHKFALFRLSGEPRVISEPTLLIGGIGNYYHDLVEYLPGLAIAETLGVAAEARLLVPADAAPHLRQMLQLLGVAPERLLPVERHQVVRFAKLYIPTRLPAGGRWIDRLLPHWYRERLSPFLVAPSEAHRKLYLSREGTTRRRIQNEAEVVARLEAAGFESVRPETLSVAEQVRLFSQASHIVGSSGAALTNMLFSPPGAQVVILQNRQLVQGGGDLYFDALAAACGHAASTLECTPAHLSPGVRSIDADLVADLDQLAELIV